MGPVLRRRLCSPSSCLIIGGGIPLERFVWAAMSGLDACALLRAAGQGVQRRRLLAGVSDRTRWRRAARRLRRHRCCSATRSHRSAWSAWSWSRSGLITLAGRGAVGTGDRRARRRRDDRRVLGRRCEGHPQRRHAAVRRGVVHLRHADDDDLRARPPAGAHEMVAAVRVHWRRFFVMGVASGITYALVQIAFQRRPRRIRRRVCANRAW